MCRTSYIYCHHKWSLRSWGETFSSWQKFKFNPANNLIEILLICFVYVLLNSTQLIWMSSSISRNSFRLAHSSADRHTVCWQEYTWLLERTYLDRKENIFRSDRNQENRIFSDWTETIEGTKLLSWLEAWISQCDYCEWAVVLCQGQNEHLWELFNAFK